MLKGKVKHKSDLIEWLEFCPGFELRVRYCTPPERDEILTAANDKVFDPKTGRHEDKLNLASLAREVVKHRVIHDWRLKAELLPTLVVMDEYPSAVEYIPYSDADALEMVECGEGVGRWLLDNLKSLSLFNAARDAARKNASSPSPARPSVSLVPEGETCAATSASS